MGLNPIDEFEGADASGTVGAGSDLYTVEGEITSLTVAGDATVYYDGEVVDPSDDGTSSDDGSQHTVEIIGTGPRTEYDLTVSGTVTDGSELNPIDEFEGSEASGTVGAGSDTYEFTGEISDLNVNGDVVVEVDGKPYPVE